MTYFYDQDLLDISYVYESAFRTTAQGKDTALAATDTTYALPILIKDGTDISLPIRTREIFHGIGSGKYPSKIINQMNEPISFTLEGPMINPAFLGYALGTIYSHAGTGSEETFYIDCLAKASITNETYFTIYNGADDYDVWFDVAGDGTWTADPTGQSGGVLKADISGDTTAAQVATTVAAAINGDAAFSATSSGARVTALTVTGTDSAHTDAHDQNSTLKFAISEQGSATAYYAHRALEEKTYAMKSFTLHCEWRNTTSGNNIIFDLLGCVVDSVEIEMTREDQVICRANILCPAFVTGNALTTPGPPGEASEEPFTWNDLQTTSSKYFILDENSTDRTPASTDKISFRVNNNVKFTPSIGDQYMAFPIATKRDVELEIHGFEQTPTLWADWRQTFDNANERMTGASTQMSSQILLTRTASTDHMRIDIMNLFIDAYESRFQSVDEGIRSADIVAKTAQPDADGRQVYLSWVDSNAKAEYHNTAD